MEYRIIDSDGCFIVEIKRYLPNKWYSPVSLFEWKSVKYAATYKAAKEWLERHRKGTFVLRFGDLVPVVERGYL